MPSVTIKPHPSASLPVLIPDLGFPIADAGGVVLVEHDEIEAAQNSDSLEALLTDNAFGIGSSTLRLNDGLTDVPQDQALAFLAEANDPEGLDSLTKAIAEDSFTEIIRTPRISQVITWASPLKVKRIREVIVAYSGGRIATVTEEQYNSAGALKRTLTSTLNYSGGLLVSVTSEVS